MAQFYKDFQERFLAWCKPEIFLIIFIPLLYLSLLIVLTLVLHTHMISLETFSVVGSSGDAWEYQTLGESILHSHTFSLDGVHPEFFRTPGYPVFVSLIFLFVHSYLAVVLVQILLVLGSAILIHKIGAKVFTPAVGLVAAVLYACDPTTILTSLSPLSDILFVFLILLSVYLIVQERVRVYSDSIVLGFLLGYVTLVRPLGLYVGPVLLLWYLSTLVSIRHKLWPWKRILVSLAIVSLCMASIVVPWMERNYLEGNHFSISSIGSYNFLFYNAVEYRVAKGEGTRDSLHAELYATLGTSDEMKLREFAYTDQIHNLLVNELKPLFFSYVMFHIIKTIPFYIGSSIEAGTRILSSRGVIAGGETAVPNISALILQGHVQEALTDLLRNPFGLLERMFWMAVLLLDIFAILFTQGTKRWVLCMSALMALAFGLLTGPVSFPRYRLPAEPFLFLGAVQGVLSVQVLLQYGRSTFPKIYQSALELCKYGAASLVALAVDVGLLVLLTSSFHINYLLSAGISFAAGITVIYVLSIYFVFTTRTFQNSWWKEFVLFLIIGIIGLLLNEVVLWICTGLFGLYYLVSKFLSVFVVFGWNFFARKRMLFEKL